jgi:uncharacterized protein (TIGR03382 family)
MNITRPLRPGPAVALLALLALAPASQAADALNGKTLYLNGPVSGGTACAACHGATPANNVNGILSAANNPSVISAAFAANRGGMGSLFNGKFSAAELADLAAYIGNPTVTAAPSASLSPSTLTFTGTTVGQSSAALSTTLSNSGNAALNLSSLTLGGSHSADFSISGGSCAVGSAVAAGASCNVQLVFRPAAAGSRNATLNIGHNATGGTSTVSLSGSGNAVATPTVALSANALNFGTLLTGSTAPLQTITVNNAGQAALSFSAISLGGANAGIFKLGGSCATSVPVAAGASCTITVAATPSVAGAFSASLNLASNASNASVAVGLSGSASAPAPALTANPSVLAFGTQTVGGAALTQTVSISNSGNVPVNFSSVAVSGAASITLGNSTCSGTLAVGASCSVPLSFAPTAAGNVNATLLLRSNAADLSVAVSASGSAAAVARPTLSDNAPFAFSDTQVGQQSAVHSITLSNSGTAALKITALALGGSQPGDFVLAGSCSTGNGSGASVSPGASCSMEVSFKPGASGARSSDLVLMTDGGAQFSLHFSGNGLAVPTSVASLSTNPQAFDFGASTIGSSAAVKRITLTNTGGAPLTLNSASFSGPYGIASDSSNGGSSCAAFPLTLAAGASCELPVSFTAVAAGNSTGNLTLQANGASWSVALSGQGVAAASNSGGAQNRGGGGCSAAQDVNDPMLAVLVLLASGVLLWRRRQARTAVLASALVSTVASVAVCTALALPGPAAALEVGQAAPGFALNGNDGTLRLEQFRGKLVYLDFWASWCGPCRQSFPWMNQMQARYGQKGLQIIGVNLDARSDDARNFLASNPAQFAIAYDASGTTPRSYGVKGMPSSVLIGADGKVLFEHSGFRAADRALLESRIRSALGVNQ